MNELRLAQIDSFHRLSDKKKIEILKEVDVHYCLQDQPHQTGYTKHNIGSTFLHAAAFRSYYDLVKELLNKEVDLLKKKVRYGRTPLLSTIDFYHPKSNCVWKMMGKLKHETVEVKIINLLLSAQIKTGNVSNPKDVKGISHFHVASAVNYTEAVEFFLKAGEPINQAVYHHYVDSYSPGSTALHFAIRYSSVEAAKILIDSGADIHLQDAQDRSPLHFALERLMDLADYINMGKRACCLVCKEEIKSIESIVHHILKSKKADINFTDDTGLTTFHMACALTDTSIAKSFLEKNVNINTPINNDAKFWPAYTPLHFAACCNVETVNFLLQRRLHITKNAAGETPLDLCMERYSPEVVHSILSCKPEFKNILLSDGSTTLLDVLLLMNDCDQFSTFLQDSKNVNLYVPHDSPLWPGNTLLHLSILMNEKTKTLKELYETFTSEESTESTEKWFNCSEKEEVAYWKRIVICLVRGCSITTMNADGLTPIHLAFKLRKANVVDKMLNSCRSNEADPNNLTHFHIACVIGKMSLVEQFLAAGIDVNNRVRSSFKWYGEPIIFKESRLTTVSVRSYSTPLHLAAIFNHIEIVELLLKHGADVYAQDAAGLTPIHHSIKFDKKERPLAQLLLNNDPNLREVVSKQNLTHLHVAAWANDAQAVEKLLKAGSDVDAVFDYDRQRRWEYQDELVYFANETPLHIAVEKESDDAGRALVRGGADITKRIASGFMDTPFINALESMDSDLTRCLITRAKREYKGITGPIDENGVTMLHVACGSFDLMWAKKLLESGADVNARVRDDDDYENDGWRGGTPLHVLISQARRVDKLPKNLMNLFKLLLRYGADVTIKDCIYTPLHAVHERNYEKDSVKKALFSSIADLFLRSHKSYDVNPSELSGFSHAYIACVRNNVEIVEKFLDCGIDIDHHTDYFGFYDATDGFTCLHFALKCGHKDMVCMLIKRGANVNAEARNGNTPLHVAVLNNCMDLELLDTMYKSGANFNAKNLKDMTPLMCLFTVENFTLEQLNFFLKRDAKFDITHFQSIVGIIGLAMKNASSNDRELIFQKLIKNDDARSAICDGFHAIHSIVSVNQDGRLTRDFYVQAIKQFIKMGCNLDQKNKEGRTALHDAACFYNVEAIEALLLLGADLNVIDKNDESPLSTLVITDKVSRERKIDANRILANHAWKIKLLELTLDSSVEKDMLSWSINKCPVDNVTQSRWKNELKKMERVKISNSLTVKSFMYEGVSTYSSMVSSERILVDNFFKNSDSITKWFPECGCLLNMQYRKTVLKLKS